MDTCARCNRPIDIHRGYFIDHNSGVTMHSLCFMGAGPKPLAKPIELPTPVPASVDGVRASRPSGPGPASPAQAPARVALRSSR